MKMADQVFHQLYYHAVWSTQRRNPTIGSKWHGWMADALGTIAAKRKAHVIAVGVVHDHVHMLMTLPPTAIPSDVVGQIKGAASAAYNALPGIADKLAWQSGYGLMTVHSSDLERVAKYVNNQAAHHANRVLNKDLENDGTAGN
jgi:putative transposase